MAVGGGKVRVFENGVLMVVYNNSPTISRKMSLGVRWNDVEPLNGAYDDVRVYARTLWPSEISAISQQ